MRSSIGPGSMDAQIFAVTPLTEIDEKLVLELDKTTANTVLDVGWHWNDKLESVLKRLSKRVSRPFSLRVNETVSLPSDLVTRYGKAISGLVIPSPEYYSQHADILKNVDCVCEVISVEEALEADELGLKGLIIKGNEAGGRIGKLASFIFMQQVSGKLNTPYWVQGGMGPFSALAAVYSGASGVVYDSQLAMMSKWQRHPVVSPVLKTLNGSETDTCHGYRFLKHGLFTSLHDYSSREQMLTEITKAQKPVIMAGMDIALASVFADVYRDAQTLIHVTQVALDGRLDQLSTNTFTKENAFAESLGIQYPIIQGPMTRVSDEPAFAAAVAENGALPSIACAVLRPDKLDSVLAKTTQELDGKPWAAGLLAFMPPELLKPQIDVVLKHKPTAVVLAGGRSEQCKQFVDNNITPIVHCPTANLFKQFLKDGVEYFIFEGRECGGHIGPVSSMTLWEMQATVAIDYASPEKLNLIFAGGIHDTLSAQMVSAMISPLTQKGIKAGLLVGTAYIFCKEAVETGAVLENFQNKAVDSSETAVVETGIGHVTRCLKTDYVDYLAEKRAEMELQGLSKQEIFVSLEQLNVGHLRIASKGIRRDGDKLINVSESEQNSKGMFMIGDVALMRNAVTTMAELHQSITISEYDQNLLEHAKSKVSKQDTNNENCAIAVVGMAAQFAGSNTIDEYWLNILEGRDLVTEVDDSRWPKDIYFDPNTRAGENEKSYSKWGAFIDDFVIDPTEFGIPPQTLSAIDAGQLGALRVSKDALIDAGYTDPNRLHNTSVIFGYEPGGEISGAYAMRILMNQIAQEHPEILEDARLNTPNLTEDSFAGILGNVLAGRVSNRLNLGGQNFTIDAACASSLAAIDSAIKELRYGESDMVIAGGVDFHNGIQDYIMFCSTYALSHKGKCFSFSDEADGIALGEGMAAVVLKRLEDAQADGDKIYGVIEGIAGSSDGKSLGLTAPRKEGQKFALNRAYQRAGISPKEIGLVEAHGTGTVVGDRTELTALEEVYQWAGSSVKQATLGTVKTQIGHTKCAAGVASLIKSVLATQYGVLPPTLNISKPNAKYDNNRSPFMLNNRAIPWQRDTRLAGVSSFGFGGTNYHAVVGNQGLAENLDQMTANLRSHELFSFSAKDVASALAAVQKLIDFIENSTIPLSLASLAWSQFNDNDASLPPQIAIVASDVDDLRKKLSQAVQQKAVIGGVYFRQSEQLYTAEQTALLFAGQGSQFVDMGRELFNYFPALRQFLPKSSELLKKWFPATDYEDDAAAQQLAAITETQVTQPLLGALAQAVSYLLEQCGVVAINAAGHSYGELAALTYAGVLPLDDLELLSESRAQAIINGSVEQGGMLAVACDSQRAEQLLASAEAPALTVANSNSPKQTVLTGTLEQAKLGKAYFDTKQIKSTLINTPYAFHSPLISNAEAVFKSALIQHSIAPSTKTVWSNLTAKAYPHNSESVLEVLPKQIVSPVRYQEMILDMYESGVRAFIEVGSGAIQKRLVDDILVDRDDKLTVSTVQSGQSALKSVLQTLAQLSVSGVTCNTAYLYQHRNLQEYDLNQALHHKQSIWLVNGQYARPLVGKVSQKGYLPERVGSVKIPKTFGNNTVAVAPAEQSNREQVMSHYLSTLNHFIDQQKQVMMQYLGAPAFATSTSFNNPTTMVAQAMPQVDSTPSPKVADVPVAASISQQVQKITPEQVLAKVTAAIAEKTGYPEEMIEADLDLESDLGIDSIKRMELLASLAETLGVPMDSEAMAENAEDSTELLKEVAGLKTATQISTWMHGVVEQAHQMSDSAPVVNEEVQTAAVSSDAAMSTPDLTVSQVLSAVTSAIAEKTGYPEEMIEPDLDLESDLGIDSIKRMELLASLAEGFGVAMDSDAMAENAEDSTELLKEVASLKTASQIAIWMQSVVAQAKGTQASSQAVEKVAPTSTDVEPQVQAVQKQNISVTEILAKVTAAIAEKTGYPEEMIEPDLDLESDLGIDSIKRMELLASLAETLGMPMGADALAENAEDSTELLKEVASLKSATQIATWMHAALNATEATASSNDNATDAVIVENDNSRMVRYETYFTPCDLGDAISGSLGDHGLIISDLDTTAFEKALAKKMPVSHVSLQQVTEQDLNETDAVFIILEQKSADEQSDAASFEQVFSVLKLLAKLPLKTVTLINSCHIKTLSEADNYVYPMERIGTAGLIAALRRELPKISLVCMYVCINSENNQQDWVDYAYAEHQLQAVEGSGHFYRPGLYINQLRYRRSLLEIPFQKSRLPYLSQSDVVVVVGGAKGITQWTAVEVAKKYGCHIVVLGRSSFSEKDLANFLPETVEQIRQRLLSEYAGKLSVADIQKRVTREEQRQMLVAGISELKGHANSVSYHQVDTNDLTQLNSVISDIIKNFGKIDGCIYGAGAIRDKFITDKAIDDARVVYDVKTVAYENFVHTVMKFAKPRFVISYSSISAILGSRGQTDYGAANEALEYSSQVLGQTYPNTRFSSIGWGPWTGIGMVDSALEEHLSRYQIYAIERQEGAQFLVSEIESMEMPNSRCFAFKTR